MRFPGEKILEPKSLFAYVTHIQVSVLVALRGNFVAKSLKNALALKTYLYVYENM